MTAPSRPAGERRQHKHSVVGGPLAAKVTLNPPSVPRQGPTRGRERLLSLSSCQWVVTVCGHWVVCGGVRDESWWALHAWPDLADTHPQDTQQTQADTTAGMAVVMCRCVQLSSVVTVPLSFSSARLSRAGQQGSRAAPPQIAPPQTLSMVRSLGLSARTTDNSRMPIRRRVRRTS